MKEKKFTIDLTKKLKEAFKERNLKITPQRIAIYEEIVNSKEHPSTVHIFEKIRRSFPNISFDTINRTLTTFAEIGLIKTVEGSGDSKRYDPNIEQHHHFICVKCGRIIDFDSKELDNLQLPTELHNKFRILRHKVVVEGICDKCSKELIKT